MNVTFENTTEYKVSQFINQATSDVILRKDLSSLDNPRQITRALNSLVRKGKLAKISYGVYVRLQYSSIINKTYLPKGFIILAREALTKLGIKWEISKAEKEYNRGISQQVPLNPPTKLLTRFRRKFSYNGRELRFE